MRIDRSSVPADAPDAPRPSLPEWRGHPAAYLAMALGGVALSVGATDAPLRAVGIVLACVGTWLLATAFRPGPDAGLLARLRDLSTDRDRWRAAANAALEALDDRPAASPRGPAPEPPREPALDPERLHHGGGRPGRLAALPADHDAEGLDPAGDIEP